MELLETLILIVIFSIIGLANEKTKPQEHYYENRIVTVYKKYQCPNIVKQITIIMFIIQVIPMV